jgi:thioesterase domain-containing protein
MTSDRQRHREALESRLKSLSKEKRELLQLLLRQENIDASAPTLGPSAARPPHDSLVAIQPFGSKPPLFCLPPVFGTVFSYYYLIPGLGLEQPVYAVSPQGIHGDAPPHRRIADMAVHAIEAMRTVQPTGPYLLAGYSFGGVIAFEVAQQLRASGDQVGLVAMIDTWAPVAVRRHGVLKSLALSLELASKGWLLVADYIALLIATRPRQSSQAHRESTRLLGMAAVQVRGIAPPAIWPMLRVYLANLKALRHYAPQPYPHRLTFFRTGKPSRTDPRDQTRGWSELASGECDVYQLSGDHISIMRRPHVQGLAKALAACLH